MEIDKSRALDTIAVNHEPLSWIDFAAMHLYPAEPRAAARVVPRDREFAPSRVSRYVAAMSFQPTV